VAGRIVLCGDLQARYEAERLLAESHPELHVESVASCRDLVQKVAGEPCDIVLLLKAPIAQHQERIHAVTSLRHGGFKGPVLFAGAFLSEREDAAAAGADLVFDPDARRVEEVVASALYRPRLAVDHPYLRFLFVGERLEVLAYRDTLPEDADVVLVATSCHEAPAFYSALPAYCKAHPGVVCVTVEDDGREEARVEALSIGAGPHVVLENEGLAALGELVRRELRAAWLRRLRG
jgi:hypothetical protein